VVQGPGIDPNVLFQGVEELWGLPSHGNRGEWPACVRLI
jgi:hypothetical protein